MTMPPDTVSVVIPAYNRARSLPHTLRSVLAQSHRCLEVIVVDDGSTDETPRVLDALGDSVKVVRQPNRGLASARNAGLALAQGAWVALLDSDDDWYPFKLELQLKLFQALPEIGVVFTDVDGVGERGRFPRMLAGVFDDFDRRFGLGKEHFFPHSATFGDLKVDCLGIDPATRIYYGPIFQHLWVKPFIIPSSVLLRQDCVIPFTEGARWSDVDFFIRIAKRRWFAYLDLSTVAYGLWGDEKKLSGPSHVAARYQRIIKAQQLFYGRGEGLNATHARHYRAQTAYFFHRIALEYLARGERSHAVRYALKSLRIRARQQAAYAILVMACAPRAIAERLLARHFQIERPPAISGVREFAGSRSC